MLLDILMPKYQRFVAWRYLLERERSLSNSVLGFVSLCIWLALGMGAACFWYPLSDIYVVPPPNPPLWSVIITGLSVALPVVALLSAVVSVLRRRSPLFSLWKGLHGAVLAFAVLGVFDQSRGGQLGGSRPWVLMVLFALLVFLAPLLARAIAQSLRDPSQGLRSLLPWILRRLWRSISGRTLLKLTIFVRALILVSLETLLIVGAYSGFRSSVLKSLFPGAGIVPIGTEIAGISIAVFAIGMIWYLAQRRSLKGHPGVLTLSLFALLVALLAAIFSSFYEGIAEVSMNLNFFGGWSSYTPPMSIIMPALIAGAVGFLALVLLVVRAWFTFFTTVSIGGVTIGTMALVIVLSIMSGFESDLREKILGFNAHIQISSVDEVQFEGYSKIEDLLKKTQGVVGFTPYLTTEAYMSNHNSYGNVTLKGVDPGRVADVTEIVHNLEEGDERALEKIWPLDEDGSILGRPDLVGLGDNDDFELDDVPEDLSGGLDEVSDDQAGASEAAKGTDQAYRELEELLGEGEGRGDFATQVLPAQVGWELGSLEGGNIEPQVAILDGVLVGRELVKTVNLYTGQEVQVISPLPDTSPDGLSIPRLKNFRIAGRFFSGMYEYDLKYVYCSLDALQDFLDVGDVVNGIEVRVKDPRHTEAIVKQLEEALGDSYRVQDWRELNRALFSALELEKIAMFFILVIIVLVASFSIIGNLIMVVIEKAKEIAILKTLGSSNGAVMKIFVTQGFFIGLVGTLLGVALGLGACYLGITFGVPLDPDVYYIDKLPINVEAVSVLKVGCAGLAISVVATIYPAFIAARLRPVKGLRWD